MNPNYIKRNTEMDRIVEAFSGYIHRHPNLDLLWSENLGYVLLSIDTVQDCLYGTSIYPDAQKLAHRLFNEVATDVILEYEDCDDISNLNDEGREEVRQLDSIFGDAAGVRTGLRRYSEWKLGFIY